MIQLFDEIARAYRSGGVSEIGWRGYQKYVIPRFGLPSPLLRYYVRQEQDRIDALVNDLEQSGFGKRLTKRDLKPHKTSDTVFVLGGGGSINQITDDQWEHINYHDSIGMNRWPIHEFVPTYHVFEYPAASYEFQTFLDLLAFRKTEYSDTPQIIKDIDRSADILRKSGIKSNIAGDLLLSCDTNFPRIYPDPEPQRCLLQFLQANGYFSFGRSLNLLYRKRASITYLIHLSILLGYQTIVLCGVDMVNSAYFFDDEQYREGEVPIPESSDLDKDETHPTNDYDTKRINLEDLIYLMNDIVLEPNDIDLYVENTLSALHPHIPRYTYD